MRKLLLVDVPESVCLMPIDFVSIQIDGIEFQVIHTELDPLTPEEINYFLTLHNHNPKGIIYAPIPEGAETKLRRML